MHRAKLEEQLVAARVAKNDSEVEELNIEIAISFAAFILENAAHLYKHLSVDQKKRLLAVLSPSGWVYKSGEGFRTGASSPAFNVLAAVETPEKQNGDPSGIRTRVFVTPSEYAVFLGNVTLLNALDGIKCCHYCCH